MPPEFHDDCHVCLVQLFSKIKKRKLDFQVCAQQASRMEVKYTSRLVIGTKVLCVDCLCLQAEFRMSVRCGWETSPTFVVCTECSVQLTCLRN